MSLPHSNTSSILATISDLSDDGNFSRVWDEVNSLSTPVETLKSQNHEENDWEMVQQTSSPHGVRKKVPHQNRGDIEPPGFVGSINGVSKKNIDGRPPRSDLPTTTNQMDGDMYSMPIHEVLGTSSKDDSDEKVAVKENHIHVPNNSKPEDTEDTTDATTDSSSSATYDSVIEDIRSKVWEEVRQARQKRKEEKQKDNSSSSSDTTGPKLNCTEEISNQIPYDEDTTVSEKKHNQKNSTNVPKKGAVELKEITVEKMPQMHIWDIRDDIDNLIKNEHCIMYQPMDSFSFNDTALFRASDDEMNDESMLDSILSLDISKQEGSNETLTENKESDSSKQLEAEKEAAKTNTTTKTTTDKTTPTDELSTVKDEVLRVKISASENSSMMYIPLSVIAKREEEMIKRALDLGVDSHQWTGSLLFRVAREKVHQYSNSQQKVNQNDLFLIELFPEYDCAEANYSQNFQWQMWLSHCIESFYKHGEMRIVDDCIGFEILVALQYLGILYRPEQLLFDSFATYLRVKLWSEYFAQRDTMTDWLTKKIKNSHSKHSHVFSSCPFPLKEGCSIKLVGSKQGSELFDGGILIDPKIHGTTRSSAVVYSFFNNDDEEITDPMNMDVLMRKDFCEFLRKRWPGMDVSFPIRLTTVSYPDGSFEQARLATLCIHLGSQSSIHQKLKHLDSKTPVDNSKKDAELSMKSESCQLFGDHALKMCMHPGSRSSPSVVSSEKDWEPVKTMDSFVTSTSSIGGMEESVFLERWMSTVSSGSQKSSSSAPCLPERDCGHMTECYSNSQSKYNEVEIKSRMRAEEKQQLGALYAHHIYEDLLLREAAFSASSLEPARKQQQFNNKTQKEKLIIIGREQRRSNKIQGKNILKSSFRGEEKKDEDGDSFVLPRPTRSTKSKKVRFLTAKKEHPNRYNILGVFQTHRKKSAKGQRTPGRKTT